MPEPDIPTVSSGQVISSAGWGNIVRTKVQDLTDGHKHDGVGSKSLDASAVASGVFALARIPTMDDAHIPNLETLSYGAAFAVAQIPDLPASKVTSGVFDLARIPTMDDAHIPNLETLSYGAAFAVAQIPDLPASKITSEILAAARGGLAKVLSPTWTNDFILVYKTATDQWVMENKPTGADHNILSATHLDTLAASVVAGDIIFGNATPKWARLAKGVDGQFLKLVSGLPAWADPPAAADHNLLSTTHPDTLAGSPVRGDVIIGNATPKWSKLAIGVSTRVLKSDGVDPSWGQVAHTELTGVTSDQHHAQLHKTSHESGGGDALALGSIAGTLIAAQHPSGLGTDLHHAQLHKASHISGGGDAFASTDLLEAVIKRLRESSGPTDLTLGSVADGEFLKRSGTSIIGGAAGGAPDPETSLDWIDDFIGGSTETGEIGDLGWVFGTSGSVSVVDVADANYLGIYRFTSGAVADNFIAATPYNTRLNFPVRFGVSGLEITLIVRCGQNTSVIYKFGFDSALSYFGEDGQKATFEFNTVLGDTDWMCVTANGTTSTRTSSGVAFAVNTWFKLKIKRNAAGNWEFYIDGVLRATNTTTLPTTTQGCNFGGVAQTKEAVAKTFDLDFARVKGTVTR